MPPEEAFADFINCCGSWKWARAMADARPFLTEEQLFETAGNVWQRLGQADWLEAFRHHPQIGQKIEPNLQKDEKKISEKSAATARPADTLRWASDEQSATRNATQEALDALARANREYLTRFGYIFIVCATGKSTEQMLALLRQRLQNDPETEIAIAAEEQQQITQLRLEKMLQGK